MAATDITKKQPPLFIRILLGMLVGVMAVGFAGVFYHSAGWWLVYVGASIVVAWGTLFILKNIYSERLAEHVFYANACHCGIALVADKLLGLGNCALNFILPILGLTTLVAVMVSAALKQGGEKEHLFYLLLNTLVAAVMAFLLVFGVITIPIPTIVYGVASMIALVVFAAADPKTLITILARKIHI